MPSIKEYREKAGKAADEIYQLRDVVSKEDREFTADEQTRWDNANKEYDRCVKQIEVLDRADKIKSRMDAPADDDDDTGREDRDGRRGDRRRKRDRSERAKIDDETRAFAFQGWARAQMELPLTKRHVRACQRVGLNPHARRLKIPLCRTAGVTRMQREWNAHHESVRAQRTLERLENRSLSINGVGSGAALVPDSFVNALEVNMLAFGGLRAGADILRTDTGADMAWPTADDTSNKGERLGPGKTASSEPEPSFGRAIWYAHKYTSKPIKVDYELLEDSAFDLPGILGAMLGERLGRITNEENTLGTGNSMPRGVIPAAGTQSAGSATALAWEDFVKLEHSIDPAYRQGAQYMLHDSILLALRLLKDDNGYPLWTSNIRDGVADRINGRTFILNQEMDSTMASGKKTVLFGQISKYKIREVRGIRLYRLQERYRDTDQDGFVAFLRQDGNLLEAGTKPVKVLLH